MTMEDFKLVLDEDTVRGAQFNVSYQPADASEYVEIKPSTTNTKIVPLTLKSFKTQTNLRMNAFKSQKNLGLDGFDQNPEKTSNMNSNEDTVMDSIIMEYAEKARISRDINKDLELRCLSLHKFSSKNICDKIKWYVYNDINYTKWLKKTMQISRQQRLAGSDIETMKLKDAKGVVQSHFMAFMEKSTIDIIFKKLYQAKNKNKDLIKSKFAAEIG
eukprot:300001_1